MKTAIPFLIVGIAAACALAATPAAGRFLILDNDQLIEGDITQAGDSYSIRRGDGETVIPAKRVVEVVGTRKQAFDVIRSRSNTRDLDERLRLVRWCMENGLRDEALLEAETLLKFRPEDTRIRTLVEGLKSLRVAAPASEPPPAPKLADKVFDIEPPDYNRDSFPMFVSKVQPILMNACASCHAAGKGGSFTLVRVTDGSNRKSALVNLTATLKHVDRKDPAASPLLTKAVTPHGNATQPPLRARQALAFQHLENWVNFAIASEGTAAPPVKTVGDERPLPEPAKKEPASRFGESSSSRTKPEPQTAAKDPFDPAIFNGTIQPKK